MGNPDRASEWRRCSAMVAVGTINRESGRERNRSSATWDLPEAGGPERRKFKLPLYGMQLLFGGVELRHQFVHHFLEPCLLAGIEDLQNSGLSCRPKVVDLLLKALIIVPVIFQNQGNFFGLFGGQIQL